MKSFIVYLVGLALIVGSIITTIAILNSDMPDIFSGVEKMVNFLTVIMLKMKKN